MLHTTGIITDVTPAIVPMSLVHINRQHGKMQAQHFYPIPVPCSQLTIPCQLVRSCYTSQKTALYGFRDNLHSPVAGGAGQWSSLQAVLHTSSASSTSSRGSGSSTCGVVMTWVTGQVVVTPQGPPSALPAPPVNVWPCWEKGWWLGWGLVVVNWCVDSD